MISIELKGYIGNNMFKIAAAKGWAEKYSRNGIIEIYKEFWDYAIYFNYIFLPINKINSNIYKEPYFHYKEIPYIPYLTIEGYFQSEKYFEHCKDEIRHIFTFKDIIYDYLKNKYKTIFNLKNLRNLVAVHIRRGDYVKLSEYHPPLPMSYYKEAVKHFDIDNSVFLVFSDDIEFCKENLKLPVKSIFYIEGNNEGQDLCLQTMCDNYIIANSSFSWWGQWLGKNDDKIVVAPSKDKWFGIKAKDRDVKDLYQDNWILV